MKIKLEFLCLAAIIITSCNTIKTAVKTNPVQKKPSRILSNNNLSNNITSEVYIKTFKDIAIVEMNKSGIPASITLAQGLLESGSGNSSLAREANNHFGIKCNLEWKGPTILRDDDNRNDCFRVYKTPQESFKDHTEFLKRKRYAFLFELDKNDYQGWARGLKDAGYATNPKYPELLISLVERYNLDQYDRKENSFEKIKREDKVLAEITKNIPEEKVEAGKPPVAMKIYEVKQGDTLYSISRRFNITVEDIRILNNLPNEDLKLGQLLLVSK
ncbi:MAG: glucosaminidase domain-containing protein [Flavobacterium sp.]|nr:glucosaminidase domain-containing protein [Pedobacter sp.]